MRPSQKYQRNYQITQVGTLMTTLSLQTLFHAVSKIIQTRFFHLNRSQLHFMLIVYFKYF